MTRTEETCKNISMIGETMIRDKVTQKDLTGAMVLALCDISKSLAIIADKMTENDEEENLCGTCRRRGDGTCGLIKEKYECEFYIKDEEEK